MRLPFGGGEGDAAEGRTVVAASDQSVSQAYYPALMPRRRTAAHLMKNVTPRDGESLARRLSWLFPVTYLIHLGEELWAGGGFPRWLSRVAGVELSVTQFLLLNSLALSLLILGSALAAVRGDCRWILVSLATVCGLNGIFHLLAGFVTATYSPGVVSGIILWLPLGAVTLRGMSKRLKRRSFRAGVAIGVVTHAAVTALTALGGKLPVTLGAG